MSNPMQPIEVNGSTLEEAIQGGLNQLGLTRNDVIIEIVEEGSKGMLGIGAREAVVRLTPLRAPEKPVSPPPAAKASPAPAKQPRVRDEDNGHSDQRLTEEELDEEATVGQEILKEMLKHMSIHATVNLERMEDGSSDEETPWVLDIHGPNLGTLIGRRGETLEAIQYLTRLIINHRLQRRATVVVDVESYKMRRVTTLKKLAQRMAAQAKQMGRTVTLEPMPPNERRIIHLTLQEDKTVRTESTGEGERRKVTIIPVE